jgi:aspartate aminotransferase-like enzyme
MNIALVVLATLLGLVATFSAFGKYSMNDRAVESLFRLGLKNRQIRLLGTVELLGALGLLVGIWIPEGITGDAIRSSMLLDYGIEIGTSFGPLHGRIWRIGTMGYNARKDAVLMTLACLEQCLLRAGHKLSPGAATAAALECYGRHA